MGDLEMMNCGLQPNLRAEIKPNTSAAGFELGMAFNTFIEKVDFIEITQQETYTITYNSNKWRIHYQNYFSDVMKDVYFNNIYAYWDDSVTLKFSKTDVHYYLTAIFVGGTYTGKFLGLIGIGDRLDSVSEEYDILFHSDLHFLAKKKEVSCDADDCGLYMNHSWDEREIIEGIEFATNYREQYSLDATDQIVEKIGVFRINTINGVD
mgnify:CR=1 FL=1